MTAIPEVIQRHPFVYVHVSTCAECRKTGFEPLCPVGTMLLCEAIMGMLANCLEQNEETSLSV